MRKDLGVVADAFDSTEKVFPFSDVTYCFYFIYIGALFYIAHRMICPCVVLSVFWSAYLPFCWWIVSEILELICLIWCTHILVPGVGMITHVVVHVKGIWSININLKTAVHSISFVKQQKSQNVCKRKNTQTYYQQTLKTISNNSCD